MIYFVGILSVKEVLPDSFVTEEEEVTTDTHPHYQHYEEEVGDSPSPSTSLRLSDELDYEGESDLDETHLNLNDPTLASTIVTGRMVAVRPRQTDGTPGLVSWERVWGVRPMVKIPITRLYMP